MVTTAHAQNLGGLDLCEKQVVCISFRRRSADIKDMDVEGLAKWLKDSGIPEDYCKRFEGKNCIVLLRVTVAVPTCLPVRNCII